MKISKLPSQFEKVSIDLENETDIQELLNAMDTYNNSTCVRIKNFLQKRGYTPKKEKQLIERFPYSLILFTFGMGWILGNIWSKLIPIWNFTT